MSVIEHAEHYLAQGCTKKEAIQKTAQDCGESRHEIYQIYRQNGKSEAVYRYTALFLCQEV